MKSRFATDVTGCPYIGVTRAYARAYGGHREVSVTSVTPVASTGVCPLPLLSALPPPSQPQSSSAKETDMVAATDLSSSSTLALDLGTTTGWAARNERCRILHGTAEFRPSRYEGGGMRYLRFGKWLDQTLDITGGIDAVFFEEVRRHAGTDASHVYGGLLATLTSWCEAHGIPYQGVPVGTWKRHVCGKGNADKQAVIIAMRERGFEPSDDNEADAIAILLWALETKGGVA